MESKRNEYKASTVAGKIINAPRPIWGRVKPDKFIEVYGRSKPVDDNSFFHDIFANGAATHSVPLVSRSSVTLLPGVFSFSPEVMEFQRILADRLDEALPASVDDEGFSDTGIHTSFGRIKCVAGYFSNPMSYVSVDNSSYRTELGLANGMSDRQRAIASEVWHLIFAKTKIVPVNVPKLSTSGMRPFTHDVQWKLAFAEYLFEPNTFEKMLDAVDRDDHIELANSFETVYAMYLQKRGQVDSPGKERRVFDLKYAKTGGKSGKEFATDKKVTIDGREYPDFSALRARVVQAGPWTVNCFLQVVASSHLHAMFEEYPDTFHVNTPEEIKRVTHGKYVFCSDVKEYDRSMDDADIKLAHDIMSEYWDPRIAKASYKLYTAPYYSRPLDLKGKLGVWVGDPRDPHSVLKAGNRSGHGFTSFIAKVNKVIDSLCIIDRIFPVTGRCHQFLKGKGPIGLVNNGDDEIVWANTPGILDRFKNLRKDLSIGRYLVEPEVGQGFSGQLLTRKDKNDLYYEPKAKIHTTFEKLWVPERSIGGVHRRFYTIGIIDRITTIMKTEEGRKAWDIHMQVYRDVLAPIHGDFMSIVMREHALLKIDLAALNMADREVLDDPGKLHYKYLDSDITPSVLQELTSKIPISATSKIVEKYYKGNIK